MDAKVELLTPSEVRLAQHAEAIRALGKRVVKDIIEIGRRLAEAKELAGHGNWLPWLEREFGWSRQTADNFTNVFEASKSLNFSNLNLPVSGLYLLAAPSTPDDVRDAALEQAADGKKLTHAQIKQMIEDARALQQQQNEGRLARERDNFERQIENMRSRYETEAKKLRAELDGALTQEAVERAIEESLAPLKKKIAQYEKQLENKKTRSPIEFAAPASIIKGSIRQLASSISIKPEQFVKAQQQICEVSRQKLRDALADDIGNAKAVRAWIDAFLNLMED